jgi:hypothetical protein
MLGLALVLDLIMSRQHDTKAYDVLVQKLSEAGRCLTSDGWIDIKEEGVIQTRSRLALLV